MVTEVVDCVPNATTFEQVGKGGRRRKNLSEVFRIKSK